MQFNAQSFQIFDKDWALLTAGDPSHYNTMTIAWGGLGTLWGKPVATVYVRHTRYTHAFMERGDFFTVSFYPESARKALALLGKLSGRDCDKVAASGLTPVFLEHGVTFREARATLVCKKIYRQDLDPAAMPEDVRARYYNNDETHTMYVGEVIDIL